MLSQRDVGIHKILFIHPQNQRVNHYFSVVLVLTFLFCSFSFHSVPGTTKKVIQVFEGSSAIDAKIHPELIGHFSNCHCRRLYLMICSPGHRNVHRGPIVSAESMSVMSYSISCVKFTPKQINEAGLWQ